MTDALAIGAGVMVVIACALLGWALVSWIVDEWT